MSLILLSDQEIVAMRRAGAHAAQTLDTVQNRLRPGVTTLEINRWVHEDTVSRGGQPSQLGYHGFPASVCTSVNNVVCHGVPSSSVKLYDGDIVNVDVTTCLDGFHGDTSRTFLVGQPSSEACHVVEVARRCLVYGMAAVRPGARLGDIGAAIVALATREGCSVVRDYCGHGIGRKMHLPPRIHHTGRRGTGLRIRAGMVFTIEPMINLGGPDTLVMEDRWTVVTSDGSWSAQFEHTILVTNNGCEVLTPSATSKIGESA